MSKEKKTIHKTKTNAQGKTVLNGSVSLGGKKAPTSANRSENRPTPPQPSPSIKAFTGVPGRNPHALLAPAKPLTGEELDAIQDRDDYIFGLEDIWENLNNGIDPTEETRGYLEEKAFAVSKTEAGRKMILEDIALFEASASPDAWIPKDILKGVLARQAEATIRAHKPGYDLSELEERSEISGSNWLLCLVCPKASYPCDPVREALKDAGVDRREGILDEMVNIAIREGQANWDATR